MKFISKFGIAAASLLVLVGSVEKASASFGTNSQTSSFGEDSINMFVNGEFEVGRRLSNGSYERASTALSYWDDQNLPPGFSSWNDLQNHYWSKVEGYNRADKFGSDGEATGTFLHNHGDRSSRNATIQQTFTLGTDIDTKALFSFDSLSWGSVRNKVLGVSVTGTQSGNLLSLNNLFSDPQKNSSEWINNEFVFDVLAGETITVEFKTSGKVSIDGVKFLVNEMVDEPTKDVPEPASILGLLAVGGIGTVSIKRHKKVQANSTGTIE